MDFALIELNEDFGTLIAEIWRLFDNSLALVVA